MKKEACLSLPVLKVDGGASANAMLMVLTLMGTALGIPLGIWLHRYVMGNIRIDMVSYAVRILWPSFAIAVALTVLFAILVDFVMYFRLDRIDMSAELSKMRKDGLLECSRSHFHLNTGSGELGY